MDRPLILTHVAILANIDDVAKKMNGFVRVGEDDLGTFKYFDFNIASQHESQSMRFASHLGDQMIHLLAEDVTNVSDIATSLYLAGVKNRSEISISTDREGRSIRNKYAIWSHVASMLNYAAKRQRHQQTHDNARDMDEAIKTHELPLDIQEIADLEAENRRLRRELSEKLRSEAKILKSGNS